MTYLPTHLDEGLRMLKRRVHISLSGFDFYEGDANQICQKILVECWNGKYFKVSTGHFSEFYIRDFGMCCESLIKLGFIDEVKKTLRYALEIYSKNKLTTTITAKGKCIDCFYYAPDSLAFLLHSLVLAKDKKLISEYQKFLNDEIKKYAEIVLGEDGLVKKKIYFSSMKDGYKRKSSCYDNCMSFVVSKYAKRLGLESLGKYNFKKLIKDNFWNGKYFLDDLSGIDYVAGDANVFPYWFNIFDDKKMIKSSIKYIQKERLDKPFPLKYTATRHRRKEMFQVKYLAPNYEGTSIWTFIGPAYIQVVSLINKKLAKTYLNKYTQVIEDNHNYLELFKQNGKPYKKLLYAADSGMVWCSMYLNLVRSLK